MSEKRIKELEARLGVLEERMGLAPAPVEILTPEEPKPQHELYVPGDDAAEAAAE